MPLFECTTAVTFTSICCNYIHHKCTVCPYSTPIYSRLPSLTLFFSTQVDTWHTTHPEGVEVYHFPSGQTEAHGVDWRKEILFPDGLLRRVYPDGREEDEPSSSR